MRGESWKLYLGGLLWAGVGAVVIAFVFTSAFMRTFTPIPMDAFNAVVIGPLFVGFVVGALLTEADIRGIAYAAILTAILSMALIYVMMFIPMITGTATNMLQLPMTDFERQAIILSSVFLIPLTIMGTILGKAFGEMALPSDEEVERRRLILRETREWHALLRGTPPGKRGRPRDEEE